MSDSLITATSEVDASHLRDARLGPRFGRMDLASQLALLAVENLAVNFDQWPRDRVALCVASPAGSLSTDVDYWKGRDQTGGPSPTLFTYTLASAPLGEIAIRHRLTGPNLCFITASQEELMAEAKELLQRGEADACVCVEVEAVTAALAEISQMTPAAHARAWLLQQATSPGN